MSCKPIRNASRLFFLAVVALMLNITACNQPSGGGGGTPLAGAGLLMVGYVQTDSIDPNLTLPCYWKDGVLTLLTTGTQANGHAQNLAVNGTDVYIFGWTESGVNYLTNKPVYWVNGVIHTLPLPTGTYGLAHEGGFDSSGNLFIKGLVTSISTWKNIPGYWENGAWIPLSMTLASGTATEGDAGNGWIDYNGDHYFDGWLRDPVSNMQIPVYWKNGAVNEVSLASLPGAIYGGVMANIVFPPNSSVMTLLLYVYDSSYNNTPAYMVGSTITKIPTGSVSNGMVWWMNLSPTGDLYATGSLGGQPPVYWLNWSIRTLPTPSGQPYGASGGASFSGGHVYINGSTNDSNGFSSAVIWIDEKLNVLDKGNYYGAADSSYSFD